jgi:hypothetical protein
MNFFRTVGVVAATMMATPSWAANETPHDSHHPAPAATVQVAQITAAAPDIGKGMDGMAAMPAFANQMKAMQAMHDKMTAAKTSQERNALMAEQMTLMQGGMGLMERMGSGAMAGKPGDMAARQGMMEHRMEMMQSMMQMMMDRLSAAPAAK